MSTLRHDDLSRFVPLPMPQLEIGAVYLRGAGSIPAGAVRMILLDEPTVRFLDGCPARVRLQPQGFVWGRMAAHSRRLADAVQTIKALRKWRE